jgi:hypothetical protein
MELKNLLPYIEGGKLICEMLDYKSDYVGKQFDIIVGVHQWDRLDKYWSVLTVGGSKPALDRIKPILEPLSNLTKPITRNGVTFTPIEWFEIGDDENDSLEYDNGNIKLIRSLESLAKNGMVNDINYLPYGVIQQLIEWKFWIGDQSYFEKGLIIEATNEYN